MIPTCTTSATSATSLLSPLSTYPDNIKAQGRHHGLDFEWRTGPNGWPCRQLDGCHGNGCRRHHSVCAAVPADQGDAGRRWIFAARVPRLAGGEYVANIVLVSRIMDGCCCYEWIWVMCFVRLSKVREGEINDNRRNHLTTSLHERMPNANTLWSLVQPLDTILNFRFV